MRRSVLHASVLVAFLLGNIALGQVRLIGISGNQEDGIHPDETLFEINLSDGSLTNLMTLTHIPDGEAIGWNPLDGLLYRTSGGEAWTDDPGREGGFRDHQYMETVNLATGELTPIFNANPPPSPDTFPSFGLAAPRPDWVLPEDIRLVDDPSPRERGENEYHQLRDLTWSKSNGLFYGSDEHGLFTLTPDGQSTFVEVLGVDSPSNGKGLAFVELDGETRLLLGGKQDSLLWIIDPEDGSPLDDWIELEKPDGGGDGANDPDSFGGLISLDQHPLTGVIYGVRKTEDSFARELVIIDPASGETVLVGNMGMHIASMTFVGSSLLGDYDNSGVLDEPDLNLQAVQITNPPGDPTYDLNDDGVVDVEDRKIWVNDLKNTYVGDANLDLEFNSGDMVQVFSKGKYETQQEASWGEGDFNGDKKFDSGDMVAAFVGGGYELGPKGPAAVGVVPEPSGVVLALLGLLGLAGLARQRGN